MLTPVPRQPRRITAGLSSARSDRGLTLTELATKVGVTPVHLSRVERGLKQPSPALLNRLTKALDVALDAISTREPVQDAA